MQVESPEALRAQVHRAFDHVEIPTRVEQMRLLKYTGDDSYEMAAALVGRKWDAVPIEVLFYHRESLATLSPLAFHSGVSRSVPRVRRSISMAPTFAAICCSRLAAGRISPIQIDLPRRESACHFSTRSIDDLGYSPRQGEQITSVTSAIGKERGYMLRVSRFASLGFSFDDFALHVHDLPEGIGIDGLLGLSFLRRFNYEVRSVEGRILIDRA